jgi:hypothetical protein
VILAAAEYAEDEEHTALPRELRLAFDWLHRYLPPRAGGSLEQPYALMRRMYAAYNVWTAMHRWREATNMVTFARSHPQEWKTVQAVLMIRKEYRSQESEDSR